MKIFWLTSVLLLASTPSLLMTSALGENANAGKVVSVIVSADVVKDDMTVSVIGPKEEKAGNQVVLEAAGTAPYKVWATDAGIGRTFENGKFYVFSTPRAGVYKFLLIGSGKDAPAVYSWHSVVIKGDGPQPPGPNPPPDPVKSLSQLTREWRSLVVSPGVESESARLASAFESVAAQISAGALSDTEEIIKKTLELNTIALGSAKSAWMPFFSAMRDELNKRDITDYAQAWNEIAEGLKSFKDMTSAPKPQSREYLYFTFTGCKACVKMKPIIMDMKSSGAVVTIVELEKSPGVVKQYGVTHYPTVVALELGSEVGRTVGETTRKAIESLGKK